jgi:ribosomal protein S18 acetylase RimI-like enzyme
MADSDDPVIRPGDARDACALSELAKRTWAEAFGWSVDAADAQAELERHRSEASFRDSLAGGGTLVAELDGELVGYAQFGPADIPEVADRPGGAVHRMYVDGPYQRRGIGTRLLTVALAQPELAAASRVYLQVWEENPGAIRFYARFGFRTIGRTRFTIGDGAVLEDLVMERPAQ